MTLKNLIQFIKGNGWTNQEIANLCGCSAATISKLGTGAQLITSHDTGKAIEALYLNEIKKLKRRSNDYNQFQKERKDKRL